MRSPLCVHASQEQPLSSHSYWLAGLVSRPEEDLSGSVRQRHLVIAHWEVWWLVECIQSPSSRTADKVVQLRRQLGHPGMPCP